MKVKNDNLQIFEIKGFNFSMWYLLLAFMMCMFLGIIIDGFVINHFFPEKLGWTQRRRMGLVIAILCCVFVFITRSRYKLTYNENTKLFTYYKNNRQNLEFHLNDIIKVRSNPITTFKPTHLVIHLENKRRKYIYIFGFDLWNNTNFNQSKQNIFKFLTFLVDDLNFKMEQPYIDKGNINFAEYINPNNNHKK